MRRKDVYAKITQKIVADLEKGVRPWMKPWNAEHLAGRISRPLRFNKEPYTGINILNLWSAAAENGFSAPIWMTYKQASSLGGQVQKGEGATEVVYAGKLKIEDESRKQEEEETPDRSIPFLRLYHVFNVEQIKGLPEEYYAVASKPKETAEERDTRLDYFFHQTGAQIDHGGNRAFYRESEDRIQMPLFEVFKNATSYYATLSHELIHWTKHPERLNRDFGRKRWGDAAYAMEELVAEIGSAFLCADLNISPEVMPEHSSYIDHWIEVLKRDQRAIFSAARHSEVAACRLTSSLP